MRLMLDEVLLLVYIYLIYQDLRFLYISIIYLDTLRLRDKRVVD